MNADLPKLLDAFAGLRGLVVGEAMLDSYWEGLTGRFCPEAPGRDLPRGEKVWKKCNIFCPKRDVR